MIEPTPLPAGPAVAAAAAPRLTRGNALLHAAGWLYLPQFLPFLLGPLTECGHCVQTYLLCFPVGPGLLAGALLAQGAMRWVLAAAFALGAVGVSFALQSALGPRGRRRAGWLVALASAGNALALAGAIRM